MAQVPGTFKVVLVPAGQTAQDGCGAGFVTLTGTPGEGTWEQWGPYRCLGELTAELAAVLCGVPLPGGGPAGLPSAASS